MLTFGFFYGIFFYIWCKSNNMKHLLALCSLVVLFTSCSTVLRKKEQKVYFFSNEENASLTYQDSTYHLPATVSIFRDKVPTKIPYDLAGVQGDTVLKGKVGSYYYLLNATSLPAFGIAYLADLTNKKRFEYPKRIFLNAKPNLTSYEILAERDIVLKNITDPQRMTDIYKNHEKRYLKEEKIREAKKADDYKRLHPQAGTHYFSILTPTFYTMGLSAKNPKLPSFTSDFGGISFGMAFDYFYKENRFVTLELKHHLNTFDPFFFVGDYDQQADKMDFSIRKGHKINRFEFSYGLSVVYTQYTYTVPKEIDQITPYFSLSKSCCLFSFDSI